MPLSANSVVFLEMTILAKSGITFFEHEKKHFYYVQALSCMHFYYFPALFSVRIPTVFQHCLRAFLLCSSTFLHAFLLFSSTFLCAHSYCIPALPHAEKNPRGADCACISIAFLLHFYCISLYPIELIMQSVGAQMRATIAVVAITMISTKL